MSGSFVPDFKFQQSMFIDSEPSAVSGCWICVSLQQPACEIHDVLVYSLVHQQTSHSFTKQLNNRILVDEPAASTFLDQVVANIASMIMWNCIIVCWAYVWMHWCILAHRIFCSSTKWFTLVGGGQFLKHGWTQWSKFCVSSKNARQFRLWHVGFTQAHDICHIRCQTTNCNRTRCLLFADAWCKCVWLHWKGFQQRQCQKTSDKVTGWGRTACCQTQ